jgi:RimJ/RimL family protein N-acetyltransferase
MTQGKIVYQGTTAKGKPLTIRYIQAGDEQSMTEYINTLSQEKTFILFQGEIITHEFEKEFVEGQLERLEKNETVHLLAFSDDKLIGISAIDMSNRVEKHVGVFGISLAKEYRGEGVGRILMEQVLEEAEENILQLRIVTLGVFANNALARSLYEKLGFVQYGSLPKGIFYKDEYIDHLYMYKVIRDN